MLFKRSDDAKRKQSIYSQISLNCYAVGDSNTGQNIVNHSFSTWVSWSFLSVAFLSLRIHLEQHCRVRRFRKEVCIFRWESIPLWGLLQVFDSFMAREWGTFRYTPIAAMYGQSHSIQSPVNFYWARQCSCRANCQENGARYLNTLPHFVIYRFILPSGKRIRLGNFNYCNSTVARRL